MDNKKKLTLRQKNYLKIIVEDFVQLGKPVGSKTFKNKHHFKESSATIRNEMRILEDYDYIEKSHSSSGRIPTNEGYKIYIEFSKEKHLSSKLKLKLKKLFADRHYLINEVIKEAVEIIAHQANIAVLASESQIDELLKAIQLVPLNQNAATILLVTSTGRVISRAVKISDRLKMNDIKIAIRIFNERLLETPLNQLLFKIKLLIPVLKETVNNFEYLLQELVKKVFDFHDQITTRVYGRNNVVRSDQIRSKKELIYILELLEKKSIWDSIEGNAKNEDDNLKIELGEENAAIISKKIQTDSTSHEISVVGSKRMDYQKILAIINYIDKLVSGKKNSSKKN